MRNWEVFMIGFIVILFFSALIVGGILLFVNRISHKKWLIKELALWKKEDLIDSETVMKIEQKYASPHKESIPPTKIVIFIGSILLGIGLIIFIASNWKNITGNIKLLGTFTLSILALLYGYYLKFNEKKPLPILGEGMLLISSLIWGATIIFLFQYYQVSAANNYLMVFIWGATIFPIAIWLKSDPVYYLSYFLLFLSGIFLSNLLESPAYLFLVLALIPFLLASENKKYKWIPVSALALILPIFTTFETYGLFYLLVLLLFLFFWWIKKEEIYLALASSSLFFFILTSLKTPILEKYFGHWFFLVPFVILLVFVFLKNSLSSLYILLFSFFFGFITQFTYDYNSGDYALSIVKIILLIGIVYLLIERFIKNKTLRLPFSIWGYLALIIPSFVLSFQELIKNSIASIPTQGLLFMEAFRPYFYLSLIVFLITIGILILWFLRRPEKEDGDIFLLMTVGISLFGIILWELLVGAKVTSALWIVTLFQNAILLTILLFTIFWATRRHLGWLINIGLLLFLIFVLMRYFDVSWKLLDRSWFFIVGGIILLGIGASMEKVRRKLTNEEKS